MTVPTEEDLSTCPSCAAPGICVEESPDSYYCADCDVTWPVIYEEKDLTKCYDCDILGIRLEGFSQETYECLECENTWHIVEGERELGLPDALPRGGESLDAWLERLDSLYPPVEPQGLAFALSLSAQFVIAECLDLDEWDEIRCHPQIADRDGFLLDIAGPSWRTLTDALRRYCQHGPTRFSILGRALLVEGLLRRGDLAEWVTIENGTRHVHPAVLEVFARTPAQELEEGEFAELIRLAARKWPSEEVEHDPTG